MKAFETTSSHQEAVGHLLNDIEVKGVRDSTTIISWVVDVKNSASEPSNSIN